MVIRIKTNKNNGANEMNQSKEMMVFENHKVEVFELNGQVFFNPRHVAVCLDISESTLRDHLAEMTEKQVIKLTNSDVGSIDIRKLNNAGENFITEAGVYKLIFKSRKPSAEKFQDWVTDEVLPTIRRVTASLETIEYKGNIDGIVYASNGVATTTSINIADVFDRSHKNILRLIDSKINSSNAKLAQFCANHIKEITYIDAYNRIQKQYELDEAGFSFIALGLTGERADEFKIHYIEAFERMKKAISDMFKARTVEAVLPQDNRNRLFIYIIKNPLNDTIKIGVAQDVDKRIKQLQTGAGIELELIYQSLICSNAFSIEKSVHAKFESFRTFGEWFKLHPDTVISFLEQQTFILKSSFTGRLSIY